MSNKSPWIHQLDKARKRLTLSEDAKTDVAIIGAGIAGVSTAFFLLKHTRLNVSVIEGDKLAHGATGHNAGQITTNFEKPFKEIVSEFGLEMASDAELQVKSAWTLLDEMYTEADLDIPLFRFTGFNGYSTKAQVLNRLKDDLLRRKAGLHTVPIEISEDAPFLHDIPHEYHDLFTLVQHSEIILKLETFDTEYIAISFAQKGVVNSALFCEKIVKYLLKKYPERFVLYEHTPVAKVVLKDDKVILDAYKHTIECDEVVLCTNGFENIEIFAKTGLSIDTRFHHNVNGVVAFMAGYMEPHESIPTAIRYHQNHEVGLTDNPGYEYFYVTRRPYKYHQKTGEKRNLVCIGGPDFSLEDRALYNRGLEFSDRAEKQITNFVRETYDKSMDLTYTFLWHGVMGYTSNLLRMVGPDPEHKRLYYNLGCNGVGILPSIFGGNKVAHQIRGDEFLPSVFDVSPRVDLRGQNKVVLRKASNRVRI